MSPDDMEKIVSEHASKLGEHFDVVRIFVQSHSGESSSTQAVSLGLGNFYAQRGHVAEWLEQQKEYERIDAREGRLDE